MKLHAVRPQGRGVGGLEDVAEEERNEASGSCSQKLVGGGHAVGVAEGHDDDKDKEEKEEDVTKAPGSGREGDVERTRRPAVVQADGVVEELFGGERGVTLV